MNDTRRATVKAEVIRFLASQGFPQQPNLSEAPTIYWSFTTQEPPMMGWISIHDVDDEPHFTASLNFGIIHELAVHAVLLDENSKLTDGFYYSAILKSLACVGFTLPVDELCTQSLTEKLTSLVERARSSHHRLVSEADDCISPLPMNWFEPVKRAKN